MKNEFVRVLKKHGFTDERAELCGTAICGSKPRWCCFARDERFPSFIDYVQRGIVQVGSEPALIERFGSFERWDGNSARETLTHTTALNRAIVLAKESGMGCVALKKYESLDARWNLWLAAARSKLPCNLFYQHFPEHAPLEVRDKKVGNNPLVIAVPARMDTSCSIWRCRCFLTASLTSIARTVSNCRSPEDSILTVI